MTHDAHIAIVGAGIGGPTAALCFLIWATVLMYRNNPRISEVGAGIQTTPNALRVFEKLGLDDA